MAEFTENLRERLFTQGWVFDHDKENINGDEMYFSHPHFPGLYVRETSFGFFDIETEK